MENVRNLSVLEQIRLINAEIDEVSSNMLNLTIENKDSFTIEDNLENFKIAIDDLYELKDLREKDNDVSVSDAELINSYSEYLKKIKEQYSYLKEKYSKS